MSLNTEKSLNYRTSFNISVLIAKISINVEKHVKPDKTVKDNVLREK